MKSLKFVLLLFLVIVFTNCNNDDPIVEETPQIVINELLPKNTQYGSDEDGDFDDWIELYNPADEDQDISGYYLADSKKNPTKWKFPQGTTIAANGYLIVWADEDSTHVSGLHTNYKLSADGENVVLLTPTQEVIDLVEYPATVLEQSYARKPNGTGNFEWATPTFNGTND
ncbi:MAG TPA: lamin tail domain-containing protein [Draconibacterium sp.]|nr:lamin tail domain-containing protein [Draconibacterium sp.]HRX11234.1 lamin tail domain-containing protein [Draconibacterium sp.]